MYAGEVAATKPPVEVEDGARIPAKTKGDVAAIVTILPSMDGWHNCPLRLSHEAEDAKEQANVVQESAACFTRVQVDSSELEDFAIVIGDDTQVKKDVPAAAQPEERAAGDVQVQTTPAAATREKLAATSLLQAEEAPDATDIVAYTNVFQVQKVNPQVVGDTTVYIDSKRQATWCAPNRAFPNM